MQKSHFAHDTTWCTSLPCRSRLMRSSSSSRSLPAASMSPRTYMREASVRVFVRACVCVYACVCKCVYVCACVLVQECAFCRLIHQGSTQRRPCVMLGKACSWHDCSQNTSHVHFVMCEQQEVRHKQSQHE